MNIQKNLFTILFSFLICTFAHAQSASDVLTNLLLNTHTIQANFTQTIQDQKGKIIQQSQGSMAIERPGKFRWEIKRPITQLIIANGARLWIYDPDLEQVTIRSFSRAAGQTPALLLSDSNLTLSKDFNIQTINNPEKITGYQMFRLIPKDKENLFASIKLSFLKKQIREMQLIDHLGHTTTIAFQDIRFDSALPASLFIFTAPAQIDVIDEPKKDDNPAFQPLASRLRPTSLDEYVGQAHLLGKDKPLRKAIEQGILHSMIFWGPPGTGKTTLARLMAERSHANFVKLSAIFSGVKDIRAVVDEAKRLREEKQQATILFVDEVHRFNKSQQDAFLPFVEDGTLILIGATTENPSFELNSALLSRARVYVLKRLTDEDLMQIIAHALQDKERGLGNIEIDFSLDLQKILVQASDGDARQVLNLLEVIADLAAQEDGKVVVTSELLAEVLQESLRRFDKGGEAFYDQISALHKSVRGSSPDATLYWFARMLDGGCDPMYIARRVLRMASEDIGNADPRALQLALNACEVYERLGSPEGELAIAQALIYLACTAKSNAVYVAFNEVMADVKAQGSLEVPIHLRNAPTKLMKQLGYGKHYRYAHNEPEAYAAGENYFPDEMKPCSYYRPTPRGLEAKLGEKLAHLRELDKKTKSKKL